MKERVKYLLLQVKYASTKKNRKWSGAKWEQIGSFISGCHSALFVALLIKSLYNLKYTYKCAEFDYRYAVYVCILNLMSLWPIPDIEKDKPDWLKNMEKKMERKIDEVAGVQKEEQEEEEEEAENDQENGKQEEEERREDAFPNSENNQIAATFVVCATIVCYYFNLLSSVDFVLLMATHVSSVATKVLFFCYTEFCVDERAVEMQQKFPDLAASKPTRMKWYRFGYALRACLIIMTIITFTRMPSLDDKCPINPAPTFISYAYLLCLLFICLGEHWDNNCNWNSLYENVLNERQYIIVGKNASNCAKHNYLVNMFGALSFLSVSSVLFYFDLMNVIDLCVIGIGSALWILLYTSSSLCFTIFVNQAMEDFMKTIGPAQEAEEGKADDVKDDPETLKDDGSLPV